MNLREFLFQSKKRATIKWRIKLAKLRRFFAGKDMAEGDFLNVPIIINNRNRLEYLKKLVSWLEQSGYKNIIILDNDSTYPPLLEYYKTFPHKIHYLRKNLGYKALWLSPLFAEYGRSWYVYTDPDMIPENLSSKDVVEQLYNVLIKYPQFEKAGVALKTDDIPEHYARKKEVIEVESKWWKRKLEADIFEAPVDTTFALYRPFAKGTAEECPACRVAGKIVFRHLPWYENSQHPSEEEVFYRNSVATGSSYWLSI